MFKTPQKKKKLPSKEENITTRLLQTEREQRVCIYECVFVSSLGVLNRPVQRGSCYWLRSAPAEPGRPHERGGGAYISLSDCAAPDVSSCGALLCVFRISDQARTLQYILLAWSAAQQPGSRSGKWLKVCPKIRLRRGVNPHIWKSWKMCECMPFQPRLSFLLFFWSE